MLHALCKLLCYVWTCNCWTTSYLANEAPASDSTPASDSAPASDSGSRAEGAPSVAMSADRRECAAVHKIRVNARTEISTVRGKHEFIGAGRSNVN